MNARISLRYDSLYNWEQTNPTPLKGEVCIVAPTTNTSPATCKIGDGVRAFATLPWLGALSTNIADWALADEKPQYNANEIAGLTDYIHSKIQDTNTQYRLVQGRDSYQWVLQAQELGASTWTTISTISIPSTEQEVAALRALVGTKSVVNQIRDALDFLDLPTVEAPQGRILTNLTQENGKVSVETRPLEIADIPALPISKVQQLQENLNKKQDNLVFDHTYDRNSNRVATVSTVRDAIDSLGKTDSPIPGQVVSAVGQTKGIIQVRRRALQASDIPTIGQNQVSGLGEVIAAKQDKLAFENNNYDPQTNKAVTQSDLAAAVAGLTSTIHFRGVVDELPATAENGDMYLMNSKEYIYVAVDDNPHWEELGDQDAYARKGEIVDSYIASNAAIQQSKIAGLNEALDEKADIASLGSAAYENNDFFVSKEEAPGYNDILTREEASSTYETQEDLAAKINSLDAEKVAAGTGEIIDSVQEKDGIVQATKRNLTANDIPVLPQSKVENLEADLAAEATAREAVQADLNSIAPNRSVCENFVVPHIGVSREFLPIKQIITYFKLNEECYLDIFEPLIAYLKRYKYDFSYTVVYYTDIYTALDDFNNGVTTNGSSDATGAIIKRLTITDNTQFNNIFTDAVVFQLLQDFTFTENKTLKFGASCLFDFNGHQIIGDSAIIENCITVESPRSQCTGVCFYGTKEGSGCTLTHSSSSMPSIIFCNRACLSMIGGNYTILTPTAGLPYNGSILDGYISGFSDGVNTLSILGGKYLRKGVAAKSQNCLLALGGWTQLLEISIKNAYIQDEITEGQPEDTSGIVLFANECNNATAVFENTTILGSQVFPSTATQGQYACQLVGGGTFVVKNCYFSAANCGLGARYRFGHISNSILEGAQHGGIYVTNNSLNGFPSTAGRFDTSYLHSRCYIQDSVLRKLDGSTALSSNNSYACYFGDGSTVYCNHVTFDSYNGNYNGPAIKTDYQTSTQVYLSNCSLKQLRVDARCFATLGAGIPDNIRALSVSGTLTNKPNETYSSIVSHDVGLYNTALFLYSRNINSSLSALSTSLTSGDLKTQSYILDTSTAAKYQFTMKDGYLYFGEVDS